MTTRCLVVLAVGVLLGACGADAQPAPSIGGSIFSEMLSDAQAGGAGEEQLAALEQAEIDQDLTLEAAREATRRTVQCMTDAGLDAAYIEETTYSGRTLPAWRAAGDDAQIEACEVLESRWINELYQMQPTSLQANEEYANQQEPILRNCLDELSIATDPDATGAELATQAAATAPECLDEAGIDTW